MVTSRLKVSLRPDVMEEGEERNEEGMGRGESGDAGKAGVSM